jgi:uncharacterized SAM-binding protein YcdF (DUF218 family)
MGPGFVPSCLIRFRRRILWSSALAATGVGGVWLFIQLGHVLHHEDPLQRADVVFALGGSRLARAVEAGELVLEGWAPRVLLSPESEDHRTEALLERRGIRVTTETDLQRAALVQIGVPAEAIEVLERPQVTTATEADAVVSLSRSRRWTRIIVVTSKLHTARARLVMQRRFAGSGIEVIMRGSRYDPANVDRWWGTREDLRFALFEAQKLLVYWAGIAD